MHIERIRIQNVKGFGEGEDAVDLDLTEGGKRTDLSGFFVVAGPNGCGKTTFLRAIALCVVHPLLVPTNPGLFWTRQGREHSNVDVWLRRCDVDDPSRKGLDGATLRADAQWSIQDGAVGTNYFEPGWQQPPWQREAEPGYFLAGYGPTRRVVGGIDEANRGLDNEPRVAAMAGLLRHDAFLAESITWLKDLDYRGLKNEPHAKDLLDWVILLLEDDLLPGDIKIVGIEPNGLRVRQRGVELMLFHLSDGYQTTSALVVDLVMRMAKIYRENLRFELNDQKTPIVKNSGVVLVDEMELHLHPAWQQKLGFWLKKHFPNVQFIVTTHSPFICQAADCLIRLSPSGTGERVAEILDADELKKVVTGGADDAVVSRLFGLPFPHSEQIEEKRSRLARLEARELRGVITEEERDELMGLQKALPYSPGASVERVLRKIDAAQ